MGWGVVGYSAFLYSPCPLTDTRGLGRALPYKERVKKSASKIEEGRKIMEELGYETRTASTAIDTSEIVAKNCIFHGMAVENNAVCALDRALISSLLEARIEQRECMVKGGNSCRFSIRKA